MKYAFLLVTLLLFACGKDDDEEKSFSCGEEVSLSQDIMPIVQRDCNLSRCHLDGPMPRLGTAEEVILHADDIQAQVNSGQMPPVTPLEADEVELIDCWVNDGAPHN